LPFKVFLIENRMKLNLKSATFIFLLVCLNISFFSCSGIDEDTITSHETQLFPKSSTYQYSYKSDSVDLLQVAKDRGVVTTNEDKSVVMYVEFKTNLYMSDSLLNSDRLDSYLEDNSDQLDGLLLHYQNGKVVRTILVENGLANRTECNNPHDGHCDDNYPQMTECSYDGIQDCVQHAVYEEWSTYTALKCAISGGLTCIIDEAISCAEENCF